MLRLFSVLIFIFILPPVAWAQEQIPNITQEPLCFTLVNAAPWTVFGDFSTDFYTNPQGTRARHRSNFRLEAAGTMDAAGAPLDTAEFCSYGPFLPGGKLSLTLRTLIPIFSCQTRIDAGPIFIKGERRADGVAKTWAECFE